MGINFIAFTILGFVRLNALKGNAKVKWARSIYFISERRQLLYHETKPVLRCHIGPISQGAK